MWSRVRRARLTFAEGDIAEAIVLSDDPDTDLALLSAAPPPGTSAARLGDAKVLRRGHLVVARDELAGAATIAPPGLWRWTVAALAGAQPPM